MRLILPAFLILTACSRKEETKPQSDCDALQDIAIKVVHAAHHEGQVQAQRLTDDVRLARYIAADESASQADRERARKSLAQEATAAAAIAERNNVYRDWEAAMNGLNRRPSIPTEIDADILFMSTYRAFEAYATTCSNFEDASGKPLVTRR